MILDKSDKTYLAHLRRKFKPAFTLLELLVVSSLIAAVGIGLYQALGNGISLWKWQVSNRARGDVLIFFSRVEQDFKNYCDLSDSDFSGSSNLVYFFVHHTDYIFMSPAEMLSGEEDATPVYRVEYKFNPEKKEIRRRVYQFGFDKPRSDRESLTGIEDLRFRFYVFSEATNTMISYDSVVGVTPAAVEVQVDLINGNGQKETYSKMIEIPINS